MKHFIYHFTLVTEYKYVTVGYLIKNESYEYITSKNKT